MKKLKLFAVTWMLGIFVTSCALTSTRQPAAQSITRGRLIKVCKSEAGAKWELYNKLGDYEATVDEIQFYSSNGAGPHTINEKTKDFVSQRTALHLMIASGQLSCVGAETFDPQFISSVKSELDNFGSSTCTETKYLSAIDSMIEELTSSSIPTLNQRNQNAILTDALREVRDESRTRGQTLCLQAVAKSKQNLNALNVKEEAITRKPVGTTGGKR